MPIKRYVLPRLGKLWEEEEKFRMWLKMELAHLSVLADLGVITQDLYKIAEEKAAFQVARIEEIEKTTHHDLNAFVMNVVESLSAEVKPYFHLDLTSYDIEDPAIALRLIAATKEILYDYGSLVEVIKTKAREHKWTYCMGVTHGQHAQPTTFGWRLTSYLPAILRNIGNVQKAMADLKISKFSGAVGTYDTISPDHEERVLANVGLEPEGASTQIVTRDVIAQLICTLAVGAGVLEKIATDFRLLAQTQYGEVQEPFAPGQMGSSKMPHKRNTIYLERICSLAKVMRGDALIALESITTWLERAIDQSASERIILPDVTCYFDYMIHTLTWITRDLVVNPERMKKNIGLTHRAWASGYVKDLLQKKGLNPKIAYEYVQKCAFVCVEEEEDFLNVLKRIPIQMWERDAQISEFVSYSELQACFDYEKKLQVLEQQFQKFGV